MIYWCKQCNVPYYSNNEICSTCRSKGILLGGNSLAPVFLQEKKLLSYILNKDVTNENIWHKKSAIYIFNGKSKKIPYVKFYKNKEYLRIRDDLRKNISYDNTLYNKDELLRANENYINALIFEAEKYIKKVIALYNNHIPAISFSGGKDSTVISTMVRETLQKNDIMHFFADTTLEFPDTYDYNNSFRRENTYTPLLESKSNSDFFSLCEYLGPPSRLERWCCTIFKTGNFNSFVKCLPDEKNMLTFVGVRRDESINRRDYKRTREDSKISRQVVAMPIINWSDFDVWLYIMFKKLQFNNAYRLGYKRVGCWCCPNNSNWSELLTAIYYPELFDRWGNILYSFARKTQKTNPADFVENKRWKARKGASGLKRRNISIIDTICMANKNIRNIIVNKPLDEKFIEFIKPFGTLKTWEDNDNIKIEVFDNRNRIFSLYFTRNSKVLKVYAEKNTDRTLLMNRLKCQIRKYKFCICCSACDAVCEQLAISTLNGEYKIDENKCNHCKKCIGRFYNGCLTTQVLAGKK